MTRYLVRFPIIFLTLVLLQPAGWCLTAVAPPQGPAVISPASGRQRLLEGFVSLTELETDLFDDAADGRLDEHSLLAAALVAGGLNDPRQIAAYEKQVESVVTRLRRSASVCGSSRRRVQAVFEFMHRELLGGGYRIDASELSAALEHGRFNCVSASLLFCCLCERFDIAAAGLVKPGHAMVRVTLANEELDIEATCPQWFKLIDDAQRCEELIRSRSGRSGSSPAVEFRRVSGVQLVATIYYNRGVDLLGRRQFAAAMAANCKAVRLDGENQTAWGNLLATLNNWAIEVGGKGRYADAAALLETGLAMDPGFQAFASNYTHVHHRWVESLCRCGRHEEALEHLQHAARRRPQEPWFERAAREVQLHWTQATAVQ